MGPVAGTGDRRWCPAGRKAEDGRLPARYLLKETPSSGYTQRTTWNVRDSDGTLILVRGEVQGGTALTARIAGKLGRPLLIVHSEANVLESVTQVSDWVTRHNIQVLNVAGPRESGRPGIYGEALRLLDHFEWRGTADV